MSDSVLAATFLNKASEHLEKAETYIEYAMTNGRASFQADSYLDSGGAVDEAKKEIASAKDCVKHANEAL